MNIIKMNSNYAKPELPQAVNGVIDVSQVGQVESFMLIVINNFPHEHPKDIVVISVGGIVFRTFHVEYPLPDSIHVTIPFTEIPDGSYDVTYTVTDHYNNHAKSDPAHVKIINSPGKYFKTIFTYSINDQLYLFRQRQPDHLVTVNKLLAGGLQGDQTSTGQKWVNYYDLIFPFVLGEDQYIFGLAKNFINVSQDTAKSYWIIAKLDEEGNKTIVDKGYWDNSYDVGFAYSINGNQFIYLHSKDENAEGEYPYAIYLISNNGVMFREPIEKRNWNSFYGATFFYSMEGNQYIYIHTEDSRDIRTYKFNQDGSIGDKTHEHTWAYYYYPQFTYFSGIHHYYAGQRAYDNYWFTDHIYRKDEDPQTYNENIGPWDRFYQYQIPFFIDERQYILRQDQSENYWRITEINVPELMIGEDTDTSDNH
ncbi:hypothetical protein J8V57_05710 [Xenorhabdus sp. PB61.4]|uniref:hypothetical protein n=1 Tax=Xenorhabdus sp. PB61.4 TaxID=2788940 RepID=UPI001E3042F0|nr:hypothetical protein [Xenorhabdus sp. PB61.4]MCC8365779.1 hypothetical protein [Xenorhabdus sp. PB61.4]